MKNYKELNIMRNSYGATIYTLYLTKIITLEQLEILNNMPTKPSSVDEVFEIIDKTLNNG